MLLLPVLVVLASIVFLGLASLADLRTGEVPDGLSYGYTVVMILLAAYGSYTFNDTSLVTDSLIMGACFFIAGFLMFYLGQWGGGDVKVLAGIGCALGSLNHIGYLPQAALSFYPYYLSYLTNLIFIAFPYAAIYGLVIGFNNPDTRKEFGAYVGKARTKAILIASLSPSLLAFLVNLQKLASFYLLLPVMLTVALYLKAVEKTALRQSKDVKDLREGDVAAEDLACGNETIASKRDIEGMSPDAIKKIQELSAKGELPGRIVIKRGIKFTLVLFLAFLTSVYLGNLVEIITGLLI